MDISARRCLHHFVRSICLLGPNIPLEAKTSFLLRSVSTATGDLSLTPKERRRRRSFGQKYFAPLPDLSLWVLILVLFCSFFGLTYFTPSIVAGFGYSPNKTQLYTVPPFAVVFVSTVIDVLNQIDTRLAAQCPCSAPHYPSLASPCFTPAKQSSSATHRSSF